MHLVQRKLDCACRGDGRKDYGLSSYFSDLCSSKNFWRYAASRKASIPPARVVERARQRDCRPRNKPVSRRRANIRAESLRRNYPPRPLHRRIRLSVWGLMKRSVPRCAIVPSLPNFTTTHAQSLRAFAPRFRDRQTALLSEPHARSHARLHCTVRAPYARNIESTLLKGCIVTSPKLSSPCAAENPHGCPEQRDCAPELRTTSQSQHHPVG